MVLHNPNNWHWVDKNCIQWSREYFKSAVVGVEAKGKDVEARITEVKSLEGDVDVCQRKGKVISLFDLNLDTAYSGKCVNSDGEEVSVSGRIKCPEIAYDTEEDEYQFEISIDDDSSAKAPVKQLIRAEIVPQLRKHFVAFGKDLITTHGSDIQHVAKSSTSKAAAAASASTGAAPAAGASAASEKPASAAAYNTTTLKLQPSFSAPKEDLFNVFVDKQRIAAWTRASPDFEAVEGSKYALFNGNITGEVLKVAGPDVLEMTWRLRDWKPNHHAQLRLEFQASSNETILQVSWSGIPIGQEEVVEENFKNYYVRPIMLTFGYGLPM